MVLAAFLLSLLLFSPSLAFSNITGALDVPNERKMHASTIARGGGLSFFVTFTVLMLLLPIDTNFKIALTIGGFTTFLIGLWDDIINLSPFQKLAGQSAGALAYILLNENTGFVQSILTFCWIVFIGNAINLCDGLNGLAGGIGSSQVLCIVTLALILDNSSVLLCSLLLLGAILGFLPRNFPQAKIFMGDCGALFLGFTLGALSSELIIESPSLTLAISIYLIFRMPIADTIYSFFRRIINGKNPFTADKGHFHHRLIDWDFSKECATLALISASLLFGLAGIILTII